jgi:hypothetical protein
MANISTNFTSLDFNDLKANLKNYLKDQDIFRDYDFDASNINVLLDILAYNTNLNAFYLNMIGNEMFLDSAVLRDSVVSHAKELNYIPRSFRSARAVVNLTMIDTIASAVNIPRGTAFTGTDGSKNFTFVTSENYIATSQGNNVFTAENVELYEGDYVSESYVFSDQEDKRYVINNKNIDTNSLIVSVIEDNGSKVYTYKRTTSLFGLGSASQVFFVEGIENERYEITFGDGVIGRRPKLDSIIVIQYRACNGELPNGIIKFVVDGKIGTALVTNVEVTQGASGGDVSESISSIKFNAPRAFTTQERVVTAQDYETLLKQNFSEINAVSAYGGEETNPPQFGKVIIAVDLKSTDVLPPSNRRTYERFIRERSPLGLDPVFVTPDYTYVSVRSSVKYNINETELTAQDIRTLVISNIQDFSSTNLDGFNKTLFYSKFITAIDNSHPSIVSNDTDVFAVKSITPQTNLETNYDIDFLLTLKDDIGQLAGDHPENEISIISSSIFFLDGLECFIEDDGEGILRIMSLQGNSHSVVKEIGEVNYETGFLQIRSFKPNIVKGNRLDIFARPKFRDISCVKQTILNIRTNDISVNVEQVRI